MTTIYERVATALESLDPDVPYALDVYLTQSGGDLPDTFLTYSLITGEPEAHADNVETHRSYLIQVSIFSRAGLVSLPDVNTAMTAAGFMKSSERQLPYDPETRHFGLAKDYIYLEKE